MMWTRTWSCPRAAPPARSAWSSTSARPRWGWCLLWPAPASALQTSRNVREIVCYCNYNYCNAGDTVTQQKYLVQGKWCKRMGDADLGLGSGVGPFTIHSCLSRFHFRRNLKYWRSSDSCSINVTTNVLKTFKCVKHLGLCKTHNM